MQVSRKRHLYLNYRWGFFGEGERGLMTPKLGTHDVFCPSKEGPTSLPLCIIVQNAVNIVFKWGPKRGFQNLYS